MERYNPAYDDERGGFSTLSPTFLRVAPLPTRPTPLHEDEALIALLAAEPDLLDTQFFQRLPEKGRHYDLDQIRRIRLTLFQLDYYYKREGLGPSLGPGGEPSLGPGGEPSLGPGSPAWRQILKGPTDEEWAALYEAAVNDREELVQYAIEEGARRAAEFASLSVFQQAWYRNELLQEGREVDDRCWTAMASQQTAATAEEVAAFCADPALWCYAAGADPSDEALEEARTESKVLRSLVGEEPLADDRRPLSLVLAENAAARAKRAV